MHYTGATKGRNAGSMQAAYYAASEEKIYTN